LWDNKEPHKDNNSKALKVPKGNNNKQPHKHQYKSQLPMGDLLKATHLPTSLEKDLRAVASSMPLTSTKKPTITISI
jgi:hypothetical protein